MILTYCLIASLSYLKSRDTIISKNYQDTFVPWILSKDVVLAVQYRVYLVKRVISLVDTVPVQYC